MRASFGASPAGGRTMTDGRRAPCRCGAARIGRSAADGTSPCASPLSPCRSPRSLHSRPRPGAPGRQPATVDDYVCTFSGDCGDQNARAGPGRRGPARGRGISATRGFALSRPDSPTRRAPARQSGAAPPRAAHNLAAPPGASAVPAAGPGQRVNLRLNFETGSANLTAAARAQAQVFARSLLMPQLRNMRFLIEGHTDSVGAPHPQHRSVAAPRPDARRLPRRCRRRPRPAGGARLRPRPASAEPALNRRREPARRGGAHFLGRPRPDRPAPSPAPG